MARIWTHGVWTVKPGREDEFVRLWSGLLDLGNELGSSRPVLLRERERPDVFHSFSSWPDLATIERFRSADEFRSTVEAMRDILESFEPHTLDEVLGDG